MQTFIQALVIKHNNDVFLTPDLEIGIVQAIPTPGAGGTPDADFWAVPIADHGIVTGFNFKVRSLTDDTKPDPQAFKVFRLIRQTGYDVWYVLGSTTGDADGSPSEPGYIEVAKAAECCDGDPDLSLPLDAPVVAPCERMCEWNADGDYFAVFGLPSRPTGWNLYGYGTIDGNPINLNAAGYATPAALANALNNALIGLTTPYQGNWAVNNGRLIYTQANGSGETVICMNFVTVNQSA